MGGIEEDVGMESGGGREGRGVEEETQMEVDGGGRSGGGL